VTDDAALAVLIKRHLRRLAARVQREAALDGAIPRPPWGWLLRDSPEGRYRIAEVLARGEYALTGRDR